MHKLVTISTVFFALTLFQFSFASESGEVEIVIDIHPDSNEQDCGTLKPEDHHPGYSDLIDKNYVSVISKSYTPDHKYHKCKLSVSVRFPSPQDYYQHLEDVRGCVPYPFFESGADYHFMMEALKRSARLSDLGAYRKWIAKDPLGCASELNGDLFENLRNNPFAFFTVFKELNEEEKALAVWNQSLTVFQLAEFKQLPTALQLAAMEYNKLAATLREERRKKIETMRKRRIEQTKLNERMRSISK